MQVRTPWTAVRFLTALYALNGLLCALGALNPMDPDTHVDLLWGLAGVGLTGAVAILAFGRRYPVPVLHAALAALAVMFFVLASQTVTVAGLVGLGPIMICVGVFVGHFLPRAHGRVHVLLVLAAGTAGAVVSGVEGYFVGWLIAVSAAIAVSEAQAYTTEELHRRADTDSLTGLANRRTWLAAADRAVAVAQRGGPTPIVALIDLDGFKAVNDAGGHAAGDELLASLAAAWQGVTRSSDLLARYGGDEFAVLLIGTDEDGVRSVLDRMHRAHPAAWSAGYAVWGSGDSTTDLISRADESLYLAKREAGRPTVTDAAR